MRARRSRILSKKFNPEKFKIATNNTGEDGGRLKKSSGIYIKLHIVLMLLVVESFVS